MYEQNEKPEVLKKKIHHAAGTWWSKRKSIGGVEHLQDVKREDDIDPIKKTQRMKGITLKLIYKFEETLELKLSS